MDTKAGEKSAQEMKNLLDVYDSRTQFASDVKDDLAQSPLTQTMGEGVSKIDQALGLSDESKAYIGALTAGLPLVGKFRKFVPSKKLTAQLDRLRAEGHALERHGGAITDEQLYARARTGVAPDGSKTRRGYTPTSTAFNSDELLVNADDFLRNNYLDDAIKNAEPGTLRIKVSADTGVELGRGYIPVGKKTGQSGPLQTVNDLTNVEAWYVYDPAKNIWQTNTIYPIPGK
ncbi:hypothetical protein [Amphritea pacifica]|uniref:hypothetical protein n=1 Tax=Amphritea pacifica TaxID=2811233 RepID=UPI0019642A8E|nr:hypothetical protein [Amphritea pacifica]MBN1008294.1 hypothetical protein [Amphritea pacifica]